MNEKSVFGDDKICDYCAEIIGDEEECQNRKVKKNEQRLLAKTESEEKNVMYLL